MSVESWKSLCDWVAVGLLFVTFVASDFRPERLSLYVAVANIPIHTNEAVLMSVSGKIY
jgi:hypothetical protein